MNQAISAERLQHRTSFSVYALLIATILIPVNVYWNVQMELVRYSGLPTTISLFFNVVFNLFVLSLINISVKRIFKKEILPQNELVVIYSMLSIGSAIAGHSMMEILPPMLGHPFWFASEENAWKDLLWQYIPKWLSVSDRNALRGYYEGDSTLYTIPHLKAWLIPVIIWSAFIFTVVFLMFCINIIFRKQWIEREKLSYPIIQLPLSMTGEKFYSSRIMWIGFGIAALIDILNGLHFLFPAIPRVFDKRYYIIFSDKPLSAMGYIPFALYPFVIGLGFMIPLDLSFSCWFFFWFWKAQVIMGDIIGLRAIPGFPYPESQAIGGYIGVTLIAIFISRKHLYRVYKQVFGKNDRYDSDEPISYRSTTIMMIIGMVFLTALLYKAGMSIVVVLIFFLLYFIISLGITRMRAELGAPVHDIHSTGPEQIMVTVVGTRKLGAQNLTILSFFWFLTRTYYSHVMPHQLEGFKLASNMRLNNRRFLLAMILASGAGIFSAFWVLLHIPYEMGALTRISWPTVTAFGREPWNRLEWWLLNPSSTDYPSTIFMLLGMLFTFLLMFMRMKFFWFPLYPAAYAVTNSWGIHNIWFCLFLAWVAKYIIMRYGGLKAHRAAIPLFFGLILGEFTVGSLWTIIGIILGISTYAFYT